MQFWLREGGAMGQGKQLAGWYEAARDFRNNSIYVDIQ
jgi:hypothetical protein